MSEKLEMIDEQPDHKAGSDSDATVTIIIPDEAIIVEDRILIVAKKDALKLMANIAIQLAFGG